MAVPSLISPLLAPCTHGFFTRVGGCSTGSFASLNCGFKFGDDPDLVNGNRASVAAELGVSKHMLLTARQVHSSTVATVTAADAGSDITADGLVTKASGLAIGVLTADCQPILLADFTSRVAGVIHGGWRGTFAGIIETGINTMESLGARRDQTTAVIGPTICQENYEVGEEVREAAIGRYPWSRRYFSENDSGRYQMDLPGIGLRLLKDEGIGNRAILGRCTYAEEDVFFSWRRSTHRGERSCGIMISAIVLQE